jgi:hypothetical protein
MSSDAVREAQAKFDEETRKLDILQNEYDEITKQINEILKEAKQIVSGVSKVGAPTPVTTRATTASNTVVKEANSYEAIETWVRAKIGELNIAQEYIGTEANTRPVLNLTVNDKLLDVDFPNGTINYQRMQTSGNDNDCLIHAILTALSPSFRTLTKEGKDPIASYFRQKVLSDIFTDIRDGRNNKREISRMIDDLHSTINLDTTVIGEFGLKYNIGVLVRDRLSWNYEGNNKPGVQYIMIYNPGKNHYEAIRYVSENRYIFEPNRIIDEWHEKLKNQETTRLQCVINGNAVENGVVIQYDKKLYSVIDVENNRDNTSCGYIYVVNYDNTQTKGSLSEIFKKFKSGDASHNVLNLVVNGKILEGCTILGNVTEHANGIRYSVM